MKFILFNILIIIIIILKYIYIQHQTNKQTKNTELDICFGNCTF